MFVRQSTRAALHLCGTLLCAASLLACDSKTEEAGCPRIDELSADRGRVDPETNMARVRVRVSDRDDRDRAILTTLLSEEGSFQDASARETTFSCARSAVGSVEICVEARYADQEPGTDGGLLDGGVPDGGVPDGGALDGGVPDAGLASPRKTADSSDDETQCIERRCIEVQCPENLCPVIERFQLEETPTLAEATVFVEVSDPDGKPLQVTTTLSASSGSFDDVHASEATYTCEPFAPNPIEICVLVSDGDPACEQRDCGEINCNLCPSLYSLSVIPNDIPAGTGRAQVQVRAEDPDDFPAPLRTSLSASSGSFEDPSASDTFYVCDGPGPVELCVKASDEDCMKTKCAQVTCP